MKFLTLTPSELLPGEIAEQGHTVRLMTSDEIAALDGAVFHRSSPIHPLLTEAPVPDLRSGEWLINFLVTDDPFPLLGKISNYAYPDLAQATWFGIGMASIVLFVPTDRAEEQDTAARFFEEISDSVWSHEVWSVSHGGLTNIAIPRKPIVRTVNPEAKAKGVQRRVPGEADIEGIVQEFDHCIRDAYAWASIYAPDELKTFDRLKASVESWVAELTWLRSRREQPVPDALMGHDLSSPLERSLLVLQRFDRIVQINSTLSYVISQGFFGSPPVSLKVPVVGRNSLLGIGRAHRALTNLVRQIENAFQQHSLPKSIVQKWGHAPPLKCLPSERDFGSDTWALDRHPDLLLQGPDHTPMAKLPYFSGRLGYRESECSVSAAIHALTSADSPEWHLVTMTHEMLHGHVREILAAVFSRSRDADPELLTTFWQDILRRFRGHMTGNTPTDFRLIDSARSIILSYCCLTYSFGSLTRIVRKSPEVSAEDTVIGEMLIPGNDEELRQFLALEHKNISEILVHVLDYFYFYSAKFDQYSRAVWSSWRTVPVVLRDVRQYVLRMLLVHASNDHGDETEQFARARYQVCQNIEQLNRDLGSEDPVLKQATALLSVKAPTTLSEVAAEASHPLYRPFVASMRIAKLAMHCFASQLVKNALFASDTTGAISLDQGDAKYGLTPGIFSDTPIRSVAEFIAWRARCYDAKVDGDKESERRSAWLFLACGALPTSPQEGDQ